MSARSDTNAIYRRHNPSSYAGPHPLGGQTVREWVKEARAGWPKVPVPKDPAKAALKVAAKYAPDPWTVVEYGEQAS